MKLTVVGHVRPRAHDIIVELDFWHDDRVRMGMKLRPEPKCSECCRASCRHFKMPVKEAKTCTVLYLTMTVILSQACV